MPLHYKDIKNDRQWRATIGLSSAKFYALVALFKASYEQLYGVSLEQGAARLGKQMKLGSYEDCLFYVLFELKNGLTYDVLGFLIGVDSSHARKLFEKYQKILEITLFKAGQLPKRNFASLEEFQALLEGESEIILDVTEVGIQRSADYEEQNKDYSGKKKHTRKTLILTTKRRKVHYMSQLYRGKVHDYTILKEEFPNKTKWFVDKKVLLDLGFQGFQKVYEALETLLPHKRKRVKKGEDNALTESQKEENKAQAQARIYAEHSIGGIKRFRIIYNQIRMKCQHDMDITLGICAGLWNFLIC